MSYADAAAKGPKQTAEDVSLPHTTSPCPHDMNVANIFAGVSSNL